jgi:eukaryotic-like serine/threonine-protein kinase
VRCLNCRKNGLALETEICPQCAVHLPSLLRDFLRPGTLLQGGHYRIDYPLGQGGFGMTYRGFDLNLERPVAIKEFYPQDYVQRESTTGRLTVPTSDAESYQRWLQRFEREGRILARLTHPGIVRVFSLFKERETAYLVMELLRGGTLGDQLKTQPEQCFSEPRVVEIMEALVAALDTVHQEGVYHLDLKPDNVMVTGDGRIVLVDFGSARQDLSAMSSSKKSSTLAFTPDYAPPELLSGQAVGAESDLFQLGMMLHEMLTGSRPPAVLSRLSQELWSPPSLGEPWRSMLTQALRLERANRPVQVKQWWQTLVNWGENQQELETQERQQEAQRQLRREAEERAAEQRAAEAERNRQQAQEQAEQREREWLVQEAERIKVEAVKLTSEKVERKTVLTPTVPPSAWVEPKSTNPSNRRGFLFAGLGAAWLGVVWLARQASQQQPSFDSTPSPTPVLDRVGANPLSPAPFASPSSFNFKVVTVNVTGQVVSREQNQARYFTEDLGGGVTLEMVEIPAGEFMMGPPVGELGKGYDEYPQHRVMVPSFCMGRFTVTQAQWQAVMGNKPAHFKDEKNPVETVGWDDAQAFCRKLSQQNGREYRLPSEAEWEYACRAGTTTPFHFGSTIAADLANYNGTHTYDSGIQGVNREKITPVGSFPPNAFGLYDMHGNVWEWCEDRYHQSYSGAPSGGSAWVSGGDNLKRILRGGSWYSAPWDCRCAARRSYNLNDRNFYVGFRVVSVALSAQ